MNLQAAQENPQFDAMLADYLQRQDRGEDIDPRGLSADPELAGALGEWLAAAQHIERMAGLPQVPSTHAPDTTVGLASPLRASTPAPKPAPQPISIPRKFGRYEVVKPLGRGAMGAVFLARDTALSRLVALKVPLPTAPDEREYVERFRREAQAAAGLRHPNICPVYDVGEIDGRLYISMAFIDGQPLSRVLQRQPLWPARGAARLIRKLALALAAAHRLGIVHRDLKPTNILIDRNGEPIVTDFGLARRINQTQEESLTHAGQVVGTPSYMSPEQLESPAEIGPQSDIFSLGLIFYELLAGCRAFQGEFPAVLAKVLGGTMPPPSSCNPAVDRQLEAICLRMVQVDRAQRYQSMNEVAAVLAAWLKEATEPAGPAEPPLPPVISQATPVIAAPARSPTKPNDRSQRMAQQLAMVAGAAAILVVGVLVLLLAGPARTAPDAKTVRAKDSVAPAAPKPSHVEPDEVNPISVVSAPMPPAPMAVPAESPAAPPVVELPQAPVQFAEDSKPSAESPAPASRPDAEVALAGGGAASPTEQAAEVQALMTARASAGEFGKPVDWKRAAEFANQEVAKRHNDGRLKRSISIEFQLAGAGIAVNISAVTGAAPKNAFGRGGGALKGGGIGGGGATGGGFGGGGTTGGGSGGGALKGGATGGGGATRGGFGGGKTTGGGFGGGGSAGNGFGSGGGAVNGGGSGFGGGRTTGGGFGGGGTTGNGFGNGGGGLQGGGNGFGSGAVNGGGNGFGSGGANGSGNGAGGLQGGGNGFGGGNAAGSGGGGGRAVQK